MTNCIYGIYFDRWELEVNKHGQLTNPDALRIIEFEIDEELDDVVATRQIARDGSLLDVDPDLSNLTNIGYDDFSTVDEALGWFDKWLEENTEWVETSSETRWQPAEYTCIGITGCVYTEEDERFRWWDNGGKEQTLYGL